ncbi:unnamed protein product [Didymodactylos carnosus]|uniref:Aquaporin n=1 Tax=Didymodactylos carnosus TaxID=1234261 RepID=A0A8S2E3Y4_9BILA|nr:unnamed protein product [Didymodactylos carnosus]CAF3817849.1 unnamed protein product [Didymodactylos carnosus]
MISKNVDGKEGDPDNKGKFISVIRPLLVELIGTCFFVLIGLFGVCSAGPGVVAAAFAFGLALMVFAASFGHISGVHFNPSVTLGVLLAGEVQPVMAVLYFVMQLLGGIAAGGIAKMLLRDGVYARCRGGATVLSTYVAFNHTLPDNNIVFYTEDTVKWWEGILIELLVTFVFITIILMVALDTKSKTGLAPVLIGFTLVACILAAGAFTGGSLNPARSLGPAIFANEWKDHYVYWVGPLAGAAIAGCFYRFIWAHSDRRIPRRIK